MFVQRSERNIWLVGWEKYPTNPKPELNNELDVPVELIADVHCKSGVKYCMGQLIQFIVYVVLGFAYQMS